MEVSPCKSCSITPDDEDIGSILDLFPYKVTMMDGGFNYLGLHLKPILYDNEDWGGLLSKWRKQLVYGVTGSCRSEVGSHWTRLFWNVYRSIGFHYLHCQYTY